MPMSPADYPADWKQIRLHIRTERAGNRCECAGQCGHDHAVVIEFADGTFEGQLRCAAINALPRARQRGWICRDYHTPWVNRRAVLSEDFDPHLAYKEAQQVVRRMRNLGYPFPAYMENSDLVQECAAELWRVSGKIGIRVAGWRTRVMTLRLYQVSKLVRGDRDKLKRADIE